MEENYLSQANLEAIKETLQLEILKRGINAPIIDICETISEKTSKHYLKFETSEFQTIPVMFKSIKITQFSSSVQSSLKSNLDPSLEGDYISVWLSVVFSYKTFDGGSNCVDMFSIWFNVFNEYEFGVSVTNIKSVGIK